MSFHVPFLHAASAAAHRGSVSGHAPARVGNWPDPMHSRSSVGNWPDPMRSRSSVGNWPDPMHSRSSVGNWPDPMRPSCPASGS
ncbi:hypothetical protein ACFVTM_04390 [Arthrobacter sp. NPDC058130]|uniref:hypothetical protein n=1 Tax=Arthrobacter sp. NPDC058130 TaxID=3346353 RepID=UPI0036E24CF2